MDEGFLLFIVTTRLRNIKLLVSFMPKQGFESRPADILGHTCLTSAQQLQIPELSVSHLKMKMDLMAVRSVYAHFTLSLTVFPLKKKIIHCTIKLFPPPLSSALKKQVSQSKHTAEKLLGPMILSRRPAGIERTEPHKTAAFQGFSPFKN